MHNDLRTTALLRTLFSAAAFAALSMSPMAARAQAAEAASCLNNRFSDGHVVLHFDTQTKADHIALSTLNAPVGTLVRISDGAHSVALAVGKSADGLSEVSLRAPLRGTDFVVSIERASVSDDAVCLTDVALSQDHHRLVPTADSTKLAADGQGASIVGTWYTTLCNPAHGTISFAADGTWQLRTNTGVKDGTWQLVDGQLQMRRGHTGAFSAMHVLTQVVLDHNDDDAVVKGDNRHTVMMFNGKAINELCGAFTSVKPD